MGVLGFLSLSVGLFSLAVSLQWPKPHCLFFREPFSDAPAPPWECCALHRLNLLLGFVWLFFLIFLISVLPAKYACSVSAITVAHLLVFLLMYRRVLHHWQRVQDDLGFESGAANLVEGQPVAALPEGAVVPGIPVMDVPMTLALISKPLYCPAGGAAAADSALDADKADAGIPCDGTGGRLPVSYGAGGAGCPALGVVVPCRRLSAGVWASGGSPLQQPSTPVSLCPAAVRHGSGSSQPLLQPPSPMVMTSSGSLTGVDAAATLVPPPRCPGGLASGGRRQQPSARDPAGGAGGGPSVSDNGADGGTGPTPRASARAARGKPAAAAGDSLSNHSLQSNVLLLSLPAKANSLRPLPSLQHTQRSAQAMADDAEHMRSLLPPPLPFAAASKPTRDAAAASCALAAMEGLPGMILDSGVCDELGGTGGSLLRAECSQQAAAIVLPVGADALPAAAAAQSLHREGGGSLRGVAALEVDK